MGFDPRNTPIGVFFRFVFAVFVSIWIGFIYENPIAPILMFVVSFGGLLALWVFGEHHSRLAIESREVGAERQNYLDTHPLGPRFGPYQDLVMHSD